MIRILFLLTILVQSSTYTFAQSGETTPEAKAKAMVSKIHKACNLQGSEWTKVNNAFTAYYKGVETLNKEVAKEKAATEVKIKELKKELNDKLTAAISAERMRIWTAFKEKEKVQE